jgi:hypothetical protein
MPKTMTTWGAYTKLEAIAAAAERLGLPGHADIRAEVEGMLTRTSLDKPTMELLAMDWKARLGVHPRRTAAFLDEALFSFLDYLDRPEVMLKGSELLDQLLEDGAETLLERAVRREMNRAHLTTVR